MDDVASNGGTVSGELFVGEFLNAQGPGTVHLTPYRTIGRSAGTAEAAAAQARYVYSALHETLHLAQRGWYDDRELTLAGYAVDGLPAPEIPKNNYLTWSGRFDGLLQNHCPYPFK